MRHGVSCPAGNAGRSAAPPVLRAGLAALLGCWLAGGTAPAGAAAPGPQRPLLLGYVLVAHGFEVMDVRAELLLTDGGYRLSLHNRSTGLIGLLTNSDVTSIATGRFLGAEVRPSGYSSGGRSRGRLRTTRIAYPDGNPEVLESSPADPDRDPVAPADAAHAIDTLGAVAGVLHLVGRTGRCDGSARLFDGQRLSLLSARTVGSDTLPASPRSPFAGAALRCDFTGRQVGGFRHDADPTRAREPQQGSAWLATPLPGAPPVPVRITFEGHGFGRATLFLTDARQGG